MNELALAFAVLNLLVSFGIVFLIKTTLVQERDRTDRYAAAVLHVSGESTAAKAVSRKEASAPVSPLQRPSQIGLNGR